VLVRLLRRPARLRGASSGPAPVHGTSGLRVTEADGTAHAFAIGAFFRELLLKGTDEVGLTLSLTAEIEAFERAYAVAAPWSVR
jgi:hypothetical protein